MKQTDYEKFCEIVLGFAELKGRQLSAPALELYWRAMQHWSIEDFDAAAQHLLLRCQFMPTPKDFEDLRKAGRPTAAEAWARVLEHIKGPYRDGSGLDDGGPIDTAVAGIGGYRALAMSSSEYNAISQRQFVDRYAESQDVADTRGSVPSIADERTAQPPMLGDVP